MTPYSYVIRESKGVMNTLIKMMCDCEDTKVFRHMAAVYVIWQQDTHQLQLEELNWVTRKSHAE